MYTQDRNQDSVKCAVRTEIRTIGSIRSGNRDSVHCTLRTRIGTACSVHPGHESGQCEVYTLDRNQDSVKCTLRTGIRTIGSIRSRNRDTVQCTLRTRIGTVGSVHSGQESGQCIEKSEIRITASVLKQALDKTKTDKWFSSPSHFSSLFVV